MPPSGEASGGVQLSQLIGRGTRVQEEVTQESGFRTEQDQPAESWSPEHLRQAQMDDPDIKHIITWMEGGNTKPTWNQVSPCS